MFFKVSKAISQNLHDSMFQGIILTAMRFFNVNPSGRIMNRFSADMGIIDETLPVVMLIAAVVNLTTIGRILVTIFANVKFSILILVMCILFFFMRKVYLNSSKNIGRMAAMSLFTFQLRHLF